MSVGIEGGAGALTSKGESRRLKGSADKGGGRGLELVPEPPGARRVGQRAGGMVTEQDKRVFVQNWVRAQHARLASASPAALRQFLLGQHTEPGHGTDRRGRVCLGNAPDHRGGDFPPAAPNGAVRHPSAFTLQGQGKVPAVFSKTDLPSPPTSFHSAEELARFTLRL